jgi:hypothetical protein
MRTNYIIQKGLKGKVLGMPSTHSRFQRSKDIVTHIISWSLTKITNPKVLSPMSSIFL